MRLATGIFDVAGDPRAAITRVGGGTAPAVLVVDTVVAELGYAPEPRPRLVRKLVDACTSAGTALILGHRKPGVTEVDRTGGLLLDLADVVLGLSEPPADGSSPLHVRKNRWGSQGTVSDVIAQSHFARFAVVVEHVTDRGW